MWFYENTGSSQNPQLQFVTEHYLTYEPGSYLNIVDINGDDAPDLISCFVNNLIYTENIGTADSPSFLHADENFQGIDHPFILPCFVDLDGDQDYDMLAGESTIPGPPSIALYRNDGTPEEPDLVMAAENYITNANFFVNANPGVADIDGDEDFDLFISEGNGDFYFYRNDGNVLNPNFTLVDTQWQGIHSNSGWKSFNFGYVDEDDDLDLLMLSEDGSNLSFYRNIGNSQTPNMRLETEVFIECFDLQIGHPFLSDIDDDGDMDLFVSDYNRGIFFFRNWGYNSVNEESEKQPTSFTLYQNYPNPFNAKTVLSFQLQADGYVSLDVFDVTGRAVRANGRSPLQKKWMSSGYHEIVWDASGAASGVYFVRLGMLSDSGNPTYSNARKVILVK